MVRSGLQTLLDAENRMFAMAREGRRTPHVILSTVMLIVMLAAAFIVVAIAERMKYGDVEEPATFLQVFFNSTVPFALMIVFLWLWLALFERRSIRTIGVSGGAALKKYLIGASVGFAMIAFAVVLMAASGSVRLEEGGPLPSGMPAVGAVLLMLLSFIIQAGSEEVLIRGWYLPVIGVRHGPLAGVLVSSVVFTAFHGFTDALATINLFLFGVFLALYCLYEGGVWGVCGWHTAWNWSQANVFGLDITGYRPEGGVLVDLQATGPKLLSGGTYGPEGSMMGSASLIAGLVVLILLVSRRHKRSSVK